MSVDEVLQQVDGYGTPLVEVTGGEPLLQDDVYPLMERLIESRGRRPELPPRRPRPVNEPGRPVPPALVSG